MSDDESEPTPRSAPAPKKKSKKPSAKSAGAAPRPTPRKLDAEEVERARASARRWDRKSRYAAGEHLVHAAFGVGLVLEAQSDVIVCLFEDGSTRKLIHAR
jgi:hypothetical protein